MKKLSPIPIAISIATCCLWSACAGPGAIEEVEPLLVAEESSSRSGATSLEADSRLGDVPPALGFQEWRRLNGSDRAATSTSSRPKRARKSQSEARVSQFIVAGEEDLRVVVEQLRTQTGLPIVLERAAEEAALDAGLVFDFNIRHSMRVSSLLDLLVEMSSDTLGWTIRHDAILISTYAGARPPLVTRMYDVRDLLHEIPSFSAPKIGRLAGDREDEERVIERKAHYEADTLLDLIVSTIDPDSWEEDGASIAIENGMLIVRNRASVHAALGRMGG